MLGPILEYIVWASFYLAFVLWIWWTFRLQEVILQGKFSRLPDRVHRMYGHDDIKISNVGNLGCRARYWRLMPMTMFVVPNLVYLFDATRPIPFIVRLLLVSGALLAFGLSVYYLDHKLVQ